MVIPVKLIPCSSSTTTTKATIPTGSVDEIIGIVTAVATVLGVIVTIGGVIITAVTVFVKRRERKVLDDSYKLFNIN